jgi:hypothetical protein
LFAEKNYKYYFFLLLVALAAWLFYPALFQNKSLVNGDNLHHGYALMVFQHNFIHEGVSPLWTNLIYGGHALFAESQGSLSNPVVLFVAWLFSPEYGHNFLHFISMVGIGVASYGFARSMGISSVGSMFASLAATFSGLFIFVNTNLTAMTAMMWIPFCMWALNAWINVPDIKRSVYFGVAMAMLIFAGYPQFFHAIVIYIFVSVFSIPFEKGLKQAFTNYFMTGFLAVVVCVGLASIQWMPLLELVSLSHRSEGAAVIFHLPSEIFLRGFLYSTNVSEYSSSLPLISSQIVSGLAFVSLFVVKSVRNKFYLLATFLLINLGVGNISPIYRFFVEWNIIPGLQSFRLLHPYFFVVVIYISIMSGQTIDWLKATCESRSIGGKNLNVMSIILFFAAIVFWIFVVKKYHVPQVSNLQYFVTIVAITAIAGCFIFHHEKKLPTILLIILIIEILLIKLTPFQFVSNDMLTRTPKSVELIRELDPHNDYKHYHMNTAAFGRSVYDRYEVVNGFAHWELENIIASSNLIWQVPSYRGSFALKQHRKVIANGIVEAELNSADDRNSGYRLIDFLGIRYISLNKQKDFGHFKPLLILESPPLFLAENSNALPKFQVYRDVELVDSVEESAQKITELDKPRLIIEGAVVDLARVNFSDTSVDDVVIKVVERSATKYLVNSYADTGYWLFLADANYPGWTASIDNENVEVYSAQILGKAVFVPAGHRRVVIYFESQSFKVGSYITIVMLASLFLLFIYRYRKFLKSIINK